MENRKLRVGIIGTGNISHCHMAGYKKYKDLVDVVPPAISTKTS